MKGNERQKEIKVKRGRLTGKMIDREKERDIERRWAEKRCWLAGEREFRCGPQFS